jgi:hypothetical protein
MHYTLLKGTTHFSLGVNVKTNQNVHHQLQQSMMNQVMKKVNINVQSKVQKRSILH